MNSWQARPATAEDLPAISALLQRPAVLPVPPEALLVLAEPGGRVLATARLVPAIGLGLPRLWYHVGCTVHAAAELQLHHRQRTLLLGHDHTGASELADIAWLRDALPLAAQASALHRLVASALHRMARERRAYADSLIVELPGLRDSTGQSPFWQGLGRHFYAGDPAAACASHGPQWRSLVAALLPRQPIYASFLSDAAQAAVGQVHGEALVLREVLHDLGLRYSHHINLEDGGPVLEGQIDSLLAGLGRIADAARLPGS